MSNVPANGHSHGFRGAGTGTDDLRLQAVRLKHVQEGIAGRHRPWETRHSRNPIPPCCFISPSPTRLGFMKYSQGLAPSATISIRNEARLVSLCSRRAIIAQCKSRHFTKATRAACIRGFSREWYESPESIVTHLYGRVLSGPKREGKPSLLHKEHWWSVSCSLQPENKQRNKKTTAFIAVFYIIFSIVFF